MADRPIHRVIYPLGNKPATEADLKRNRDYDKKNIWGERNYFWDCHREGGDFDWLANNLATAEGSPTLEQIAAAWTFADTWNPESTAGPKIESLQSASGQISLSFNESVTVKGQPRLKLQGGQIAGYAAGSGSKQLSFALPTAAGADVLAVDLNGGSIIACEASAQIRFASLALPDPSKSAH
jgi:pectinesterase